MLDPKTPLAAAAIFGAGILVGQDNLLLYYLYQFLAICCIRVPSGAAGYRVLYPGRE